jgi:hypothetical protein
MRREKMQRRIAFRAGCVGACAAVFLFALCASAIAQENAPKQTIALKAARMITAVDDTVVKNGVVIIECHAAARPD